MYITQISVYLENIKGTLRQVTRLLADAGIDLLALSIADTTNFGIVRFIIREQDVETALTLLQAQGHSTRKNEVLCLQVPNRPGGLDSVLAILEEAGISIEYMYSLNYSPDNQALLIFRLSDQETAVQALKAHGIVLYSKEEVAAL